MGETFTLRKEGFGSKPDVNRRKCFSRKVFVSRRTPGATGLNQRGRILAPASYSLNRCCLTFAPCSVRRT